jgi:hypothetical protein
MRLDVGQYWTLLIGALNEIVTVGSMSGVDDAGSSKNA